MSGIRIEPSQFRVVGNTQLNIGGDSVTTARAPSTSAIAVRVIGRVADNVGIVDFVDNGQTTQYAAIRGDSNGLNFNTGSTSRPYTFQGGRVNSNTVQPSVIAFLGSDQTGVIGGTNITFDTEIQDQAGNFASSTFTAPVAGAYLVAGAVQIKNNSGSNATVGEQIALAAVVNGSTFYSLSGKTTPLNNGEAITLPISAMLALAASDTLNIRLAAGGGQSLTAVGNASSRVTWVAIRLLV